LGDDIHILECGLALSPVDRAEMLAAVSSSVKRPDEEAP
jgi:hypothetical protein